MIISEYEQNTKEWMSERAGIPTASKFDNIVTMKGDLSKSAEKYMYQLAGERLLGFKPETYSNAAMKRGIELEAEAKELYSLVTGETLQDVGLCWKDEKNRIGASPDSLIANKSGILEVKCPELKTFIGYRIKDNLHKDYWQQIQGQMYVCDKEWCDIMAYYPGLEPIIKRVEMDKEFIYRLEVQLNSFCDELDEITNKLRG